MFKKITLITSVCFILVGCASNNDLTNDVDNTDNTEEENILEKYTDDNIVKVGLYNNSYLVKEYGTYAGNFKDIGVFDVYFTNIDKVDSSNTKVNYQKYIKEYENIENHKIGFYISFVAEDSLYEEVILDPSKQHKMEPYIYVYLYDDINQAPGTYYSHLEMDDMKDNTIFSSIKLFFAHNGYGITSPITLTVFTYNGMDDFDENGMYRGNSSYTIEINIK